MPIETPIDTGPDRHDDTVVSDRTTDAASVDRAADVVVSPIVSAHEQPETIRDRWLIHLVERIGTLERAVGRLEAERDQARHAAEGANRDLNHARHDLEVLTLERDQFHAERDALLTAREALRDRVRMLEARVRSAQDTTALRAIERDEIPQVMTRRGWWPFGAQRHRLSPTRHQSTRWDRLR